MPSYLSHHYMTEVSFLIVLFLATTSSSLVLLRCLLYRVQRGRSVKLKIYNLELCTRKEPSYASHLFSLLAVSLPPD